MRVLHDPVTVFGEQRTDATDVMPVGKASGAIIHKPGNLPLLITQEPLGSGPRGIGQDVQNAALYCVDLVRPPVRGGIFSFPNKRFTCMLQ